MGQLMLDPEVICVTCSKFMSTIAEVLYTYAPNYLPRKIETIMEKARASFQNSEHFAFDEHGFPYITLSDHYELFKFVNDILMEIDEFKELSLTQVEFESSATVKDPCNMLGRIVLPRTKDSWKNEATNLSKVIDTAYKILLNHHILCSKATIPILKKQYCHTVTLQEEQKIDGGK